MDMASFSSLTTKQLSRLLKLDDGEPWDAGETSAILQHQLSAHLLDDLAYAHSLPLSIDELRQLMRLRSVPLDQTFMDQLLSPRPVVELLEAIKTFARQMRDEPTSPLRGAPSTALYYAAIAAAMARYGRQLSRLSQEILRDRFEWVRRQAGTERLEPMLTKAICILSANTDGVVK